MHKRRQIAYFGKESEQYDSMYHIAPWMEKYIERMFRYIRITNRSKALDDGCGSGYVTLELAKRGARVYACDINIQALKRLMRSAKRLGVSQNIIPVCCSSEYLPLRMASVDIVVTNSVLEHLEQDQLAASEISRVTRKHAVLMATVPIAYRYVSPVLLPLHAVYDRKLGHLRRYTKHSLSKLFPGWKQMAIYYSGHTAKAVKTLINIAVHIFDETSIEEQDAKRYNEAIGSTNITMFFKKQ